ncbi:MAG: nuclear transport factor 2 family protein [Egibacteraceae bacterium]
MKTPREVAESYWRAECERDLEAVLEHYHTDAVVQPPSGPSLRGRDEIATFYADELRDYPHLEVQIVHEVSSGDEASLEWEAVLTDHEGGRHPQPQSSRSSSWNPRAACVSGAWVHARIVGRSDEVPVVGTKRRAARHALRPPPARAEPQRELAPLVDHEGVADFAAAPIIS